MPNELSIKTKPLKCRIAVGIANAFSQAGDERALWLQEVIFTDLKPS